MVGETISHYRVVEKLGQGGMGEVFLAQDTSLDRKVALKLLSQQWQHDPTARKRFLREAGPPPLPWRKHREETK